jgi:hypothetical protein
MAKGLIEIALQLGKQLGANTSKFLGTKSNVTFMGPGPKDGMLFQKSINPESFASLGIEKVLPDIESSLGYAVGGKLNDIQLNKLIDNMSIMADVLDPLAAKNIVDASSRFGGGLGSLEGLGLKNLDNVRAKSGLSERQATEIASDRARVKKEAVEKYGISPERFDETMNSKFDEKLGDDLLRETSDTTPLMSKLENRVSDLKDAKAPINELENYTVSNGDIVKNLIDKKFGAGYFGDEAATGIMATVDKGDLPAKTGAAREFLVNSLKVGDDYPSTTLSDVMSAEDMKYIFEGGGGAMGDPLVLVQKYFGPRIAEMVPTGGSSEEIAIFTKRVMDNVEDARGLKPDEPGFDNMTAKFVDELSEGTYSFGYQKGKEFQSNVNSIGKGTLREIIDSGELMGDDLEAALNALRSRKAYGGRAGYAKGGLAKILEL